MEAGRVQPGPEPFVRAEVVHSSERTRVTRLFLPGRMVIRKEPLGPDAERRARQEVAMLERSPGRRAGDAAGGGAAVPRVGRARGRR